MLAALFLLSLPAAVFVAATGVLFGRTALAAMTLAAGLCALYIFTCALLP